MQYRLVWQNGQLNVEQKVSELIADGWEPLGGIAYYAQTFVQAMVKKEPPKKAKGK